MTTEFQFNDAQKKKGTDELRPGLQLDARCNRPPLPAVAFCLNFSFPPLAAMPL